MAQGLERPSRLPRQVAGTFSTTACGAQRHGREPAPAPPRQRLRAKARPPFVQGRAAKIWAEVLPALPWLHRLDRYCFAAWCCLQAEFKRDPAAMMPARLSLLRLLAWDLGLTAAGRARLGFMVAPPAEPDPYLD